jgi:acetyl esterase/lipase
MFLKTSCAVLILTAAALAQQSASPEREWPSMKLAVTQDLEYAQIGGKGLSLDLYLPQKPKGPLPVIVWIHGEEGRFAGKYPSPVASMAGNEYAVASIDYRSLKEASFPAQLQDCKAAIRWLRANASKYGLDPAHIGVWGLSEGGRMAALLGTTGGLKEFEGTGGNLDQSSRVQAVVDFAGPVGPGKSTAANPAGYASKDDPPFMILHGDSDRVVPLQQSQTLDSALRKAGVDSTLRTVAGAGNDFKQLRQGEQVELVNQFLDKHLKGGVHVRYWIGKIDPPDDAWVDPIIDEPQGTKYVLFPARSLGPAGQASCLVYLPPDYAKSAAKRYPVLYFLHGGGGSQRTGDIWVQKLDAAIQGGKAPAMIAVLVEGLPGGRYLDTPDGKTPIESVIIKDLVPYIDAHYRTIARRQGRALEGISMGGYGVFHLGFKFPELIGMISGWANGITANGKTYTGAAAPPSSPSDLAESPYTLAEKNLAAIRNGTAIRIIVGTDDFTLAANEEFHAHLVRLGIPHEYKVVKGIYHGYKEYYENLDFTFFKTIATK